MRAIATRLLPGHDLRGELEALARHERLDAGWVLTGVGSLASVRLRLAGGTDTLALDGAFEIVSLVGTLSLDGAHLHLAVADPTGAVVGGHLSIGCVVRTTAEIVVGTDDRHRFGRRPDPATGYDELTIDRLPPGSP